VLRRNPDHDLGGGYHALDVDDGRALAEVVDHGVTHTDDALRSGLIERSIEVIGGRQDEIRNPHLPDALAHGIAQNMDVVDHLVNDDWNAHRGETPPRSAEDLRDFLTEVVRDESASGTVARAVEDWSLDEFRDLPAPGDGTGNPPPRTVALERVGQVQGTVLAAETGVLYDSVEEYLAHQEARADVVNFTVGVVPFGRHLEDVVGPVNDAFDIGGFSLGEVLSPASAAEEYDEARALESRLRLDGDLNNRILLAVAEQPEGVATPLRDMSEVETEALLAGMGDTGDAYDDPNHVLAGLVRAFDQLNASS
jgi:hypothetical protein